MYPQLLSVDVHCTIPSWVTHHPDPAYRRTIYRVYVDGELFTERTWIYGNNIYLEEQLYASLDSNVVHKLEIVPVLKNVSQAKFSITNFKINNSECHHSINETVVNFKLQ